MTKRNELRGCFRIRRLCFLMGTKVLIGLRVEDFSLRIESFSSVFQLLLVCCNFRVRFEDIEEVLDLIFVHCQVCVDIIR